MAIETYANNAVTTLSGAINDSQTYMDVIDSTLFPTSGQTRVGVGNEIILVKGGLGTNSWNPIERGVENTQPASHNAGINVEQILTNQGLLNLSLATSSHWLDADTLDPTYGDDFSGNSLNTKWTRRNIKEGQDKIEGGSLIADFHAVQGGYLQSLTPSDDLDVTLRLSLYHTYSDSVDLVGPVLVDSSGNGVGCGLIHNALPPRLWTADLASYIRSGGGPAPILIHSTDTYGGKPFWLQIAKRGSFYAFRISGNGDAWGPWGASRYTALTLDRVGILQWNDATDSLNASFKRFNVHNRFNVGNNLVITPSSGSATYTASSSIGGYPPENAADGDNIGDPSWAPENTDTDLWWQVTWSVPQTINRVRLFSRNEVLGQGIILTFSDSSKVYVPQRVSGDQFIPVEFPTISTTSLRVTHAVHSTNGGFAEIEAYLGTAA